jgi:hypothetical protein
MQIDAEPSNPSGFDKVLRAETSTSTNSAQNRFNVLSQDIIS